MTRFAQFVAGGGGARKAVQDVEREVTNHDIQPYDTPSILCSEHKITGPKTTRQTYAGVMKSFDTTQTDIRFMSSYFTGNCQIRRSRAQVVVWISRK